MSNNKDSLEKRLQDAKEAANDLLKQRQEPIIISKESVVEVAKTRSAKDYILWIVALLCLIAATLVPEYLGAYWAPASNIWVRIAVIVGLVVVALVCIAFTHQGGAFKTLLKDAGVELRRITWPSKSETTTYTWQVIVVTIITGILVWLLDNLFNCVVGFILG
ncbi:MAG: preprotein translocase subunit SecE [Moraxella sp.]|nr:preprotein translocase subunit SecE [Moraxella sp.]